MIVQHMGHADLERAIAMMAGVERLATCRCVQMTALEMESALMGLAVASGDSRVLIVPCLSAPMIARTMVAALSTDLAFVIRDGLRTTALAKHAPTCALDKEHATSKPLYVCATPGLQEMIVLW